MASLTTSKATIIHVVALLQALNVRDYGVITVFINGDAEISSQWFVVSRRNADKLSLTNRSIAMASMTVKGKASHAGVAPKRGISEPYEMTHQVLQLRLLRALNRAQNELDGGQCGRHTRRRFACASHPADSPCRTFG